MAYAEAHKIRNTHVDVFFLYVGNREVESVHKTTQTLDERSMLPKSHVANMVREHQTLNKTRYKLISLLRYNHTHEMEDIMNTEPDEPSSMEGLGPLMDTDCPTLMSPATDKLLPWRKKPRNDIELPRLDLPKLPKNPQGLAVADARVDGRRCRLFRNGDSVEQCGKVSLPAFVWRSFEHFGAIFQL